MGAGEALGRLASVNIYVYIMCSLHVRSPFSVCQRPSHARLARDIHACADGTKPHSTAEAFFAACQQPRIRVTANITDPSQNVRSPGIYPGS